MGNSVSVKYINYEDIQYAQKNNKYVLINTLKQDEQGCLISGTLDIENETKPQQCPGDRRGYFN